MVSAKIENEAALTIQTKWRSVKGREEATVRRVCRELSLQREAWECRIELVTVIQKMWRATKRTKELRRERTRDLEATMSAERGWAAVAIQLKWRATKAKRNTRRPKAATTLQCFFRSCRSRRHTSVLRSMRVASLTSVRQQEAVLSIQSAWRCHRVRMHLARRDSSALLIQAWYKTSLRRRQRNATRHAVLLSESALVVQNFFKTAQAQKHLNAKLRAHREALGAVRRHEAASYIQQAYKCHTAKTYTSHLRMNRRATLLTTFARHSLAVMHTNMRKKVVKLIKTLQRVGRASVSRSFLSDAHRTTKLMMTTRIVPRMKGAVGRRSAMEHLSHMKEKRRALYKAKVENEASATMQRMYRVRFARRETVARRVARKVIRDALVAQMYVEEERFLNHSAEKIQQLWRQHSAECVVTRMRQERRVTESITELEDRVIFEATETERRRKSANLIAAFYKGCKARAEFRILLAAASADKEAGLNNETATIIQSWFRGRTGRHEARTLKERKQAVAFLQRTSRGCMVRGRLSQQRAASVIQRNVKSLQAREEIRRRRRIRASEELAERRRIASLVVQRNERSRQAKTVLKKKQREAERREMAATKIQAGCRSMLTRRDVTRPLQRERDVAWDQMFIDGAALELTRAARGFLARLKVGAIRKTRTEMATTLSRVYRGILGRREAQGIRDEKEASVANRQRDAAALMIQSNYRVHLARKARKHAQYQARQARLEIRFREEASSVIHSMVMGGVARMRVAVMYRSAEKRCALLQKVGRGCIERSTVVAKGLEEVHNRCAEIIQKNWKKARPQLQHQCELRLLTRKINIVISSGFFRNEKAERWSIDYQRQTGMEAIQEKLQEAKRDDAKRLVEYKEFVSGMDEDQSVFAANRIKDGWKCKTATKEKKRRARELLSRVEEDLVREVDEERFTHQMSRTGSFTGIATSMAGAEEWTGLLMRLHGRREFAELFIQEASQRAGIELLATCMLDSKLRPLNALRKHPRSPARADDTSIETININLGDSIHNVPRNYVRSLFGKERAIPPPLLPPAAGKSPLSAVRFSGGENGCIHVSSDSTGLTSLTHQIALNDPVVNRVRTNSMEIRDSDVKPLLHALKYNTYVRELDLSGTSVGDRTAEEVASLMVCNNALTAINLSNTNITDVGSTQLAAAIAANVALTKLSVDGTLMSPHSKHSINEQLRHKHVTFLPGGRLKKEQPQSFSIQHSLASKVVPHLQPIFTKP